jgi:antitoxin MazE
MGKFRGICLPKRLLDRAGLSDEVEVEVQGSRLVIRSARASRAGWAEAFARMGAAGDDGVLDTTWPDR